MDDKGCPYTADQLARVIVYLGKRPPAFSEDVQDCIDWARQRAGGGVNEGEEEVLEVGDA